MGTISLSLPSDGSTIDAADVNTPFNTVAAVINGNIDDDNIKTGANINGTKILANSIPPTAFDVNARAGWENGILAAPNTITALGNRSYSIVFNTVDYTGALSAGMRLRTTRTVAAPTQCTSLNGTTQYYSKSSPSAMTFTDDFVVSAWVKLSAYQAGTIASRSNGTSGWALDITAAGIVRVVGFNGAGANFSLVQSYQSLPLNKWVHITGQLDMSAFTATPTTSYVMFDGVDVPANVTRGGTNPTALIQAGNLEIGTQNAGTFWPGKIAQVAIYSAKVTQATILASMHQTLSGSETSLISAYTFNNEIVDKSANANNLTANGSAVATNADSPFGGQADGTISSTLDYAIITKTAFSTNTTLTVQVPEGCTIPTTGGVSAVSYSTQKVPYLFPAQYEKWQVENIANSVGTQSSPVQNTWYNVGNISLTIPIGAWRVIQDGVLFSTKGASTVLAAFRTLSTANNSESDTTMTVAGQAEGASGTMTVLFTPSLEKPLALSAATTYYLNMRSTTASASAVGNLANSSSFPPTTVRAILSLL